MKSEKYATQRIAPIQSVERAIWILKCFEQHEHLSLSEIVKLIGLHKSTTYGLVSTLEAYQLIEKDNISGKYHLGIELFRLGNKVNIDLRSIVSPYLNLLVSKYEETANCLIFDKDSIIYLDKKESPHSMRIATSLGQREPLYRTAAGKAILSRLPSDTAAELLDQTVFEKMTEHTLCSAQEVQKELDSIRKNGYAVDNEELETGLVCVGTALINSSGTPVGGISVSGPVTRMTPEYRKKIASDLVNYALEIQEKL